MENEIKTTNMDKLTERKKIILNILLKWMAREAKLGDKMAFRWGRKIFKIRRVPKF